MVHAADRQAIARLRRVLDDIDVGGIQTTLPFGRFVARHPTFIAGDLSTGWVADWDGAAQHAGSRSALGAGRGARGPGRAAQGRESRHPARGPPPRPMAARAGAGRAARPRRTGGHDQRRPAVRVSVGQATRLNSDPVIVVAPSPDGVLVDEQQADRPPHEAGRRPRDAGRRGRAGHPAGAAADGARLGSRSARWWSVAGGSSSRSSQRCAHPRCASAPDAAGARDRQACDVRAIIPGRIVAPERRLGRRRDGRPTTASRR